MVDPIADNDSLERINSVESTAVTRATGGGYLVGVYDTDDIGEFFGALRRSDNIEKVEAERSADGDILWCFVDEK